MFWMTRSRNPFCYGIFCMLSLTILCACSGIGKKRGEENLQNIVAAFNSAVRWSDFKTASNFIPPSQRQPFWDLTDEIARSVRILDFQVREVSVLEKSGENRVTVRYLYYYTDDPNIKTKNLQQHWTFSPGERSWFVMEHNLQNLTEGRKK
ncbi:MAG: hypothetical protein KBH99_09390 [Syntrophobacteraceae bacterium]|nr:hypothetical protein [Syntrophobacteraceae bacterium]